tara:strand:+ start:287 stop:745 length:459 start_codon:yes stop_codon:yes gene_type:complete
MEDYNSKINSILDFTRDKFLDNVKNECNNDFYKYKINNLIDYFKFKDKDVQKLQEFDSNVFNRLSKIDEYIYKKPWNKLPKQSKLIKLKEFISEFINSDITNAEIIKTKLLTDFENNKLNSACIINYNSFKFKIISISKLSFNKEKNLYEYN